MIPACFQHLVTLRSCAPTGVTPLYYLDDLPGWSFQRLSDSTGNAAKRAQDLAVRTIDNATDMVLQDVLAKLRERVNLRESVEQLLPDPWQNGVLPPSGLPRGLQIERRTNCGRLSCLYIESLLIAVNDTIPALDITVEAGADTNVYTVDDVQAGEAFEVPIDLTTQAETVRITLPPGVRPFTLNFPTNCGCSRAMYRASGPQCVQLRGWNGTHTDSRMYGVQVRGAIRCCTDNLLCVYRNDMADLVRWRAGMELAMETHVARQVNATTLNTDQTEILYDNYKHQYHLRLDNWFERTSRSLASLRELCIECNRTNYTYAY